jgi:integrase
MSAGRYVRVRRGIVKRRVEPPKTKYGKRSVPIPPALVSKLRAQLAGLEDASPDALVLPSTVGTPLDPDTIRRDTLKPLMEEIGAAGAGFHILRHTYASMRLARGVNMLALSRALGHHSPAFTLSVYCHLLEGDEAPALDLSDELARGNARGNAPHRIQTNSDSPPVTAIHA